MNWGTFSIVWFLISITKETFRENFDQPDSTKQILKLSSVKMTQKYYACIWNYLNFTYWINYVLIIRTKSKLVKSFSNYLKRNYYLVLTIVNFEQTSNVKCVHCQRDSSSHCHKFWKFLTKSSKVLIADSFFWCIPVQDNVKKLTLCQPRLQWIDDCSDDMGN